MTDFSADKLRALDERMEAQGLDVRIDERANAIIEIQDYLFDHRAAILAMAEHNKRMRAALEQIAGGKMAGWKSGEVAQQALGKDQA